MGGYWSKLFESILMLGFNCKGSFGDCRAMVSLWKFDNLSVNIYIIDEKGEKNYIASRMNVVFVEPYQTIIGRVDHKFTICVVLNSHWYWSVEWNFWKEMHLYFFQFILFDLYYITLHYKVIRSEDTKRKLRMFPQMLWIIPKNDFQLSHAKIEINSKTKDIPFKQIPNCEFHKAITNFQIKDDKLTPFF